MLRLLHALLRRVAGSRPPTASPDALSGDNPFDTLPPPLVREIFTRLPADERARAACVCPAWRRTLAEPALWTRLDLTYESGGVRCLVAEAALHAVAARAQGRLEALTVELCEETWPALRAIMAANGASLREVTVDCVILYSLDSARCLEMLQELQAALPALEVLEVPRMSCYFSVARLMLRNQPPFELLRLRRLSIYQDLEIVIDMPTLAADILAHPSLTELTLFGANGPPPTGAVDALIDVAPALRLKDLRLQSANLTPVAVPALARVLSSARELNLLSITNVPSTAGVQLLDAATAPLFANALRANRTLWLLSLTNVRLWDDVTAGVVFLNALVGHPSLCFMDLTGNQVHNATDALAVGAALGALVAADTPAFHELHVGNNGLGDDGLLPLCEALPRNSHMRKLLLRDNGMSDAFMAERLLPVMQGRANFDCWPPGGQGPVRPVHT